MTDKPILSVEEKIGLMRSMADNDWVTYVESLIRVHVVKALDKIELPENPHDLETIQWECILNYEQKIKTAIQKAKEAYL